MDPSDHVFATLVEDILSGALAVGDLLAPEDELARRFDVTPQVIRGAILGIEQSGLVKTVRPGVLQVLDWRENSGLRILSILASTGAVPALRLVHDVCVMRRMIGADAARISAAKASPAQRAAIMAAAADYPDQGATATAVFAADVAFWTAVVDGADNIAYRLALNTLIAGFYDVGFRTMLELGLAAEVADRAAHVRLAQLIGDGLGAEAFDLASDLLGRVVALVADAV